MIATEMDMWLQDEFECKARWICDLNDGTVVYQDDERPDAFPVSAWVRLNTYCAYHSLYITRMRIKFRSHIELVGQNADGFYFINSALGQFGSDKTEHFFICGTLDDDIINCVKWRVPELIEVDRFQRDPESAGLSLIRRWDV